MWANKRRLLDLLRERMEESPGSNKGKEQDGDVEREEWNKRRYGITCSNFVLKITFQIDFYLVFYF